MITSAIVLGGVKKALPTIIKITSYASVGLGIVLSFRAGARISQQIKEANGASETGKASAKEKAKIVVKEAALPVAMIVGGGYGLYHNYQVKMTDLTTNAAIATTTATALKGQVSDLRGAVTNVSNSMGPLDDGTTIADNVFTEKKKLSHKRAENGEQRQAPSEMYCFSNGRTPSMGEFVSIYDFTGAAFWDTSDNRVVEEGIKYMKKLVDEGDVTDDGYIPLERFLDKIHAEIHACDLNYGFRVEDIQKLYVEPIDVTDTKHLAFRGAIPVKTVYLSHDPVIMRTR